jgi:hypothetical protein
MKRGVIWSIVAIFGVVSCISLWNATAAQPTGRGRLWAIHVIDDSSRGADGVKLADVNGDKLQDIVTGWEEGGLTRVYLHPGPAKAKGKWPAVTVGKTPSVEDAVFIDLSADGIMDVVTCCEGKTRTIFLHSAPARAADYLVVEKWTTEPLKASKGKMMWMFAFGLQVDGRNGVDIVAGGKGEGAQIGWFESPDPRKMGGFKFHAISDVGWVMSMFPCDMDGDGDADIVTSDRRGKLRGCRWLENPGPDEAQAKPWKNHFIGGRDDEVMFMTLADLDADGLTDVLVAAKTAKVLFIRRLDKTGKAWAAPQTIPYPDGMGHAKAVAVGDINSDKLPDLVITCEGATSPKSGVVWMSSEKPGDPQTKWTAHEISGPKGVKYDRIELLDIDRDGDLDVLTCEEREGKSGLGVFWYENPTK